MVAEGGDFIRVNLFVANDGPTPPDVTVECRFGESTSAVGMYELLAMETAGLLVEQITGRFPQTVAETFLGDVSAHTAVGRGLMLRPRSCATNGYLSPVTGSSIPRPSSRARRASSTDAETGVTRPDI